MEGPLDLAAEYPDELLREVHTDFHDVAQATCVKFGRTIAKCLDDRIRRLNSDQVSFTSLSSLCPP